MKINIGCDLVNITRFKSKILKNEKIMQTIFLPSELCNTQVSHLAGVFAAKEATMKALGLKPGDWLKIEVSNKKSGKPFTKFSTEINKKIIDYDLSISHDGNYVFATAVVLIK